jgi:hypothetical protein
MAKRILLALLWGTASYVWLGMAHAFLGGPDLSLLGGLVVAAAIVGTKFSRHAVQPAVEASPQVEAGQR